MAPALLASSFSPLVVTASGARMSALSCALFLFFVGHGHGRFQHCAPATPLPRRPPLASAGRLLLPQATEAWPCWTPAATAGTAAARAAWSCEDLLSSSVPQARVRGLLLLLVGAAGLSSRAPVLLVEAGGVRGGHAEAQCSPPRRSTQAAGARGQRASEHRRANYGHQPVRAGPGMDAQPLRPRPLP